MDQISLLEVVDKAKSEGHLSLPRETSEADFSKLGELFAKGDLSAIRSIDVLFSGELVDLAWLSGASSLEELRINGCANLRSTAGLSGARLKSLKIIDCVGLVKAQLDAKYDSLALLDLPGCDALEEINTGHDIPLLDTVVATYCRSLKSIDFVSRCPSIRHLFLNNAAELTSIQPLSNARCLEHLSVRSCTSLRSLDGIQGCEALSTLLMSNCVALVDISGLPNSPALEHLDFSRCVSLSEAAFRQFAIRHQEKSFPNLRLLELQGSGVSVLGRYSKDPNAIVSAYLNGEQLNVGKAVILGRERCGKTWFFRRVFQDIVPSKENATSTHGFEVAKANWISSCKDGPITLYAWDFAGEQFLHGLHQAFLTETDVAILVLDITQSKERNSFEYWERFLRGCIPQRHSTLIVRTKSDQGEDVLGDVPAHRLVSRANAEQNATVIEKFSSNKSSAGQVATVRQAIDDSIATLSPRKVVAGTNHLIEIIKDRMRNRALAKVSEYVEWCAEANINKEMGLSLLSALRRLGEVLYFYPTEAEKFAINRRRSERRQEDKRQERQAFADNMLERAAADDSASILSQWIVSPRWLNEPLYEVLRSAERAAAEETEIRQRGFVSVDELNDYIVNANRELGIDGSTDGEQLLVLSKVIELTRLGIRSRSSGRAGLYFPANRYQSQETEYSTGHPDVRIQWEFFDLSALHQVIVHRFDSLKTSSGDEPHGVDRRFWRYGMVICGSHSEVTVIARPLLHCVDCYFRGDINESGDLYVRLQDDLCDEAGEPDKRYSSEYVRRQIQERINHSNKVFLPAGEDGDLKRLQEGAIVNEASESSYASDGEQFVSREADTETDSEHQLVDISDSLKPTYRDGAVFWNERRMNLAGQQAQLMRYLFPRPNEGWSGEPESGPDVEFARGGPGGNIGPDEICFSPWRTHAAIENELYTDRRGNDFSRKKVINSVASALAGKLEMSFSGQIGLQSKDSAKYRRIWWVKPVDQKLT